jgi:arsenate reductase
MAEGWARHLKGDKIEAYSAGTEPKRLDPYAVKVMAEAGVDISSQRSKHVSEMTKMTFDYVVTVCDPFDSAQGRQAAQQCPNFTGAAKVIHVGFDDPPKLAQKAKNEQEALAYYCRVRDEIRAFVEKLPHFLNIVL